MSAWRVAGATLRARIEDRALLASCILAGLLAAGLAFTVAVALERSTGPTAQPSGLPILAYATFASSLAAILGLAVGALTPVALEGETRIDEATGAWLGSILVGVVPTVVGLVLGFAIGLATGGSAWLGASWKPLLGAALAVGLVGAAWTAVSLAISARSPTAARAFFGVLMGYASLRVLLPVATTLAQAATQVGGANAPAWWLSFTFVDPSALANRYLAHLVLGQPVSPAFAQPPALDTAAGMLLGLVAWCAIPLAIALSRWPETPSPPSPSPSASPGELSP